MTTEAYGGTALIEGLKKQKLLIVERDDNEEIKEEYFIKLINYTTKTGVKAAKEMKTKAKEERRKFYKINDWDQYEETVIESNQYE